MKKTLQVTKLVKFLISFGLIIYLVKIINWKDVIVLTPFTGFLVILGSFNTLLVLYLMAWRWSLLLISQCGHIVSVGSAYRGYLRGSFYNMIMPGSIGGDLLRIKYGRDHFGLNLKQSTVIIITERTIGAVVQILFLLTGLGIGGFILLTDHLDYGEFLLLFSIGIIVFLLFHILKIKLQLSSTAISKLFLLSVLAQGIDLIVSTIFLFFLWPDSEFFWLLIVMPLSFFVTALPISLSGLGVRECVMVGILQLFDMEPSKAVIFSLMLYFSKIPVALAGGILLAISTQRIKLKFKQQS